MTFCMGKTSRVAPLPAVTSSAVLLLPLNRVYFQNFLIRKTDQLLTIFAEIYICSNRPFSKMAAEIQVSKTYLKLKTYTSIKKNTFTLVTLQSFNISGLMSAEKM